MSCYSFVSKLIHRSKKMSPHEIEIINSYKLLLEEKNKEISKKDEAISQLEKKLEDKELMIKYLQNEIDKFRQVVKPITQKIMTKQISLGDELWSTNSNSLSKNRTRQENEIDKELVEEPQIQEPSRIKREGISAEPVNLSKSDLQIRKIPKTSR